jgi:predicted aspartyl protease
VNAALQKITRRLLLAILPAWLIAAPLAADFYQYVDRDGVRHFVDDAAKIPPAYRQKTRAYPETYDDRLPSDRTDRQQLEKLETEGAVVERADPGPLPEGANDLRETDATAADADSEAEPIETPVVIRGNSVYVPVTLGFEGRDVEALLVLDTGATIVTLHHTVAEQLGARPSRTARAMVAGGGTVRFKLFQLDYIQVGPIRAVKHQGLLGMNFLKHHEYRIDYQKSIIQWKP